MKKGISIWAFAEPSLEKCMRTAKDLGYEGVEVALDENGEIALNSTKEDLLRIKEMAARIGISLYSVASGLYWKYSLTANDPAIRQKAIDIVRKQLDTAAVLGCDTILVIPGMVSGLEPGGEIVPYDIVYERAFNTIKELALYAEEKGVTIGLENVWNQFLLSPLEMKTFIDQIGSTHVGAYFDVGNVMKDGYPEQWIHILGKRIAKVHFKDFKRNVGSLDGFVDLLNGDVDYPAVMAALRAVGYDGWVTAEVFPYAHYPETLIRTASAAMDSILGQC